MVCAKYQGKQLGIITYHSESKKRYFKTCLTHNMYMSYSYIVFMVKMKSVPKININIVGQKYLF